MLSLTEPLNLGGALEMPTCQVQLQKEASPLGVSLRVIFRATSYQRYCNVLKTGEGVADDQHQAPCFVCLPPLPFNLILEALHAGF